MKSGDKVICIDDNFDQSWVEHWGVTFLPKKGQEYTIRDGHECRNDKQGDVAVHLVECPNKKCTYWDGEIFEPWFYNWHFAVIQGNALAMPEAKPISIKTGNKSKLA